MATADQIAELLVSLGGAAKRNLGTASLVEAAIRKGEGHLSAHGALVVATGRHTCRSARDKFIVCDGQTESEVWWGKKLSAVRVELAAISPREREAMLAESWSLRAPKRLLGEG